MSIYYFQISKYASNFYVFVIYYNEYIYNAHGKGSEINVLLRKYNFSGPLHL